MTRPATIQELEAILNSEPDELVQIRPDGSIFRKTIEWPDPTPEMLKTPEFNAVWNLIKSWDINVPEAYCGYMSATGNHVRAILDALALTKGAGKK